MRFEEEELRQFYELRSNDVIDDLQFRRQRYTLKSRNARELGLECYVLPVLVLHRPFRTEIYQNNTKITKKREFICVFQKKKVPLQRKSQNSVKMMSRLSVYIKGIYAGELEKKGAQGYVFTYDEAYRTDSGLPALCLNMPKSQTVYESERLFPVFANMLAEGYNRRLQSRTMRIDENDDFALLAATAQYDTIGAITVRPIED